MNVSRIKETCIYVSDLSASRHFYHGLLGLPVIAFVAGRHVFFQAGDSVLLCFIAAVTLQEKELPPHGAKGIIHFAFEVSPADYMDAVARIESAGIDIIHHHTWKKGTRSFYFNDPDDNLVEIAEAGLWDNY